MSLPAAATIATAATETAADTVAAAAPLFEGFAWWHYVVATAVAVRLAAPMVDVGIDLIGRFAYWTAGSWDNKAVAAVRVGWRWVKAITGGLTRRKK